MVCPENSRVRVGLAGLLLLSGCSAIIDVDKYETAENACDFGDPETRRDFTFHMTGGAAFADFLIEARLVDASTSTAVARMVFESTEPDMAADMTIVAENAVPPGDLFLVQVYADKNDTGMYEPTGDSADPAWSRSLCQSGLIDFVLDNNRANIEDPPVKAAGEDFKMEVHDASAHAGQLFALKVIELSEDRPVVGYYQKGAVPDNGEFNLFIPGIMIPGQRYRLEYWADFDGSKGFSGQPTDHAWSDDIVAEDGVTTFVFNHNFDFKDLENF